MSSIVDPSINKLPDSAAEVKEFFDKYFSKKISVTSNQVDSVIGFFRKRGFNNTSAIAVSTVLLQQAKVDNVNIFQLLDTLQGLNEVSISKLVATILNSNRSRVSNIGFTIQNRATTSEERNIIDNTAVIQTASTTQINTFDNSSSTFDNNASTFDQGVSIPQAIVINTFDNNSSTFDNNASTFDQGA